MSALWTCAWITNIGITDHPHLKPFAPTATQPACLPVSDCFCVYFFTFCISLSPRPVKADGRSPESGGLLEVSSHWGVFSWPLCLLGRDLTLWDARGRLFGALNKGWLIDWLIDQWRTIGLDWPTAKTAKTRIGSHIKTGPLRSLSLYSLQPYMWMRPFFQWAKQIVGGFCRNQFNHSELASLH